MERQRLFIAIDISDETRRAVKEYVGQLSEVRDTGVRWEKTEKIHLTLKFLGDTDAHRIPRIQQALSGVVSDHSAFDLTIEATGVFPNRKNARVLWLGVRDSVPLLHLHRSVETALEKVGSRPEQRIFSPHLTIARVKDPRTARLTVETHLRSAFRPVRFAVNELVLYESKTLPTGSIYSVIAKSRLS